MPDSHGEVRTPEVISHALKNLDDAALVRVLGNLMSSHPQVAPRIVNMALPELTFLPTKALVAKRSLGVIVQVGNDGGMIECPELEAAFGSAVLVGRNQLGPYTVGQEVSFAVTINEDNKPQAFDLQVIPGLGAAATSLAAGVLPLPLLPLPGLLPGLPGLPGALPGATLPPGLPAGLPATLPGALPGATLPGLPAALSAALPAGLPLPMPGLLPGLAAGTLPPELPPQPAPVVKTPPAPVQTPTQSPNGDQILGTFLGVVRTVDEDKGFGFITSDQLRGQGINEDCYVHKHYLGREFNVGSEVSFTAFLDARNGRPRAKDLKDAKGKVGRQSTMMPPAAPTLPGAGLGLPGLGLPLPGLGAGLTAPAPGMPCAAGGEKEDSIGTYKGTVKSYNALKGFGFIVCPELQKEGWSDDIYLQRKNTNDMPFKSGDYVSFEAFIFQGRLQGRNPMKLEGTATGSEAESWGEGTSWDDGGSCGGCGGCGWTKGDAIAKGKFKGAKGKGKGPMGINPMAMNMMMAMMGMGGKG